MRVILITFLFFPFILFAQIPNNKNVTDSAGLRQGKWTILYDANWNITTNKDLVEFYRIIEYEDDLPIGIVRDYYRNGVIQSEGRLLKDRPESVADGLVTWYRKDGTREFQATYSNGEQQSFVYFNLDETIAEEHWDYLNTRGNELAGEGDSENAKLFYDRALEQSVKQFGENHYTYTISLVNLGIWHDKQGNFSEAEKRYKEALSLLNELYGSQNEDYVFILDLMGWLYLTNNNYSQAELMFKEVVETRKVIQGTNNLAYCESLDALADVYDLMGQYSIAEPLYTEALNIRKELVGENHIEYSRSLSNLASLYQEQGLFEKARPMYEQTKAIAEKVLGANDPEYATVLNNIGLFYRAVGEYARSESVLLEAYQIYIDQYGENDIHIATLLHNFGHLYSDMGLLEKSITSYEKSLEMRKVFLGENDPEYARTMDNLAIVYDAQGQFSLAEQYYLKAMEIRERVLGSGHPEYSHSLNNLGVFYDKQGLHKRAEPFLLECLNLRKEVLGESHPDYSQSLNNLAALYVDLEMYDKVEPLHLEALRIRNEVYGEKHPATLISLSNLAAFYYKIGQLEKVESSLVKVLEIRKEVLGEMHPDYATSLNNLAAFYDEQGFYTKAEPLYLESIRTREQSLGQSHPAYALALNNLAQLYKSTGEYEKAEPLYISALNIKLQETRQMIYTMSESERKSFIRTNQFYFGNFYSFAILRAETNPSISRFFFDLQLETKALLFQSTQKMQQQILASEDKSLINDYYEWKTRRTYLAKVIQMTIEEKQKAKINQEELENEVNELERRLSQKSSSFANTTDSVVYSWKDVRDNLKKGEAAVEIIRVRTYKDFRDTVYVALIVKHNTKDYPQMITLDGYALENKFIKAYRNSIAFRIEDRDSYNEFLKPIANHLKGVKKMFLSADGVYHQINLKTLLNPETNKYAADELEIQVISSSREILNRKKPTPPDHPNIELFGFPSYDLNIAQTLDGDVQLATRSVFGMDTTQRFFDSGNIAQLPGTKREVELIDSLALDYNLESKMNISGFATEQRLKETTSPYILHMATHGFFLANLPDNDENAAGFLSMDAQTFEENPLLRSGLLFAGATAGLRGELINGEDGVLTAQEALSLNLDNTQLVVMSACETGLGEISNGEGVYGLNRAFQQAGARNILMSLWKVSDSATQEMMVIFYRNVLEKKLSIRESFNRAQQELRSKYSEPYYWGAFVLIGD